MNRFFAFLSGTLIGIMVMINGLFSVKTELFYSLFIIHIVGFSLMTVFFFAKKNSVSDFKKLPFYFFVPGFLGVFLTLINNITYANLGATITLSLGIIGQLTASLAVDSFGLFGLKKIPLNKKKIPGYLIIICGIIFMLIF